MDRTNCKNCGAVIELDKDKCPYCRTPYVEKIKNMYFVPTNYYRAGGGGGGSGTYGGGGGAACNSRIYIQRRKVNGDV